MDKLEQLIRAYLQEAKMMQLATSVSDQPWVCNVWFAADEACNLYWFSSTHRRHSQEARQNPKLAGSMCLPQAPTDKPRGLQFQGIAQELSSPDDIAAARTVYQDRIFPAETIDALIANPDKPHKFYKITPELFVLFDAINYPNEYRQEWKL